MTQPLRIAILVPDPDNLFYAPRWPELFERLAEPLRGLGARVEAQAWIGGDAPDALLAYDLVLPLLVWGYHLRAQEWAARIEAWRGLGVRLNPGPDILAWNSRKAYLAQLAERGAPVVPSLMSDQVVRADLEAARSRFGAQTLVVKPQVSAGAHCTVVVQAGDSLDGLPEGPVVIQPFLPAVGEEGELSLFYFGGQLSHAVTKVAKAGDFRVQPQFGGLSTTVTPSPLALAAAASVMAAAGFDLLYARVDLIRCLDGRLGLMELEIIEPDLFMAHAPDGGAAFAAAVMAAVRA
jgi:hypothetical protein